MTEAREKNKKGSYKKKLFYLFISSLPKFIRHKFYREMYARVPANIPSGLTFELAISKEDIEAAFKLLHDAYVEQGFIRPQASGMRLIVQHALPTTSILIAKMNGTVVGTISVMRDTPLGLPMEKAFKIHHLKSSGNRVAEMSCLAIHPDFRRSLGGDIFFPLTIFAAMYAQNFFGTDSLIFNLYPHHADFYNAIFGSSHLNSETEKATDYLGAPASAIHLDLTTSYAFGQKEYAGKGAEKDLFEYTYKTQHAYFKYPQKETGVINYPVMTPELFNYFFVEKTNIFENMTQLETQVVARYYPLDKYSNLVSLSKHKIHINRINERWDIHIDGVCLDAYKNSRIDSLFLDVSYTGFKVHIKEHIVMTRDYSFEVHFANGAFAQMKAIPVWRSLDGVYGFKIIEANYDWFKLVEIQASALKMIAS